MTFEADAISILASGLPLKRTREESFTPSKVFKIEPPSPPRTVTPEDIKYDVLENGSKVPRFCGDCKSKSTSGHWCQDPSVHNGHICQKCYRRRKRTQSKTQYLPCLRNCESCSSSQTARIWFKHPSLYQRYVCEGCYLQDKRETLTNPDEKSCSCCMTKDSNRWYSDTKHPGMFLCRKCYRKQHLTIMDISPNGTRKRRACSHCSAKETSHWYPSSQGYICRNCYSKSNGLKVPLEKRYCNSCKVSHTSQWHTDHHSSNGYICRKCYLLRRTGSEVSSVKSVEREPMRLPCLSSIASAYLRQPLQQPVEIVNQSLPPIHSYLKHL